MQAGMLLQGLSAQNAGTQLSGNVGRVRTVKTRACVHPLARLTTVLYIQMISAPSGKDCMAKLTFNERGKEGVWEDR